MFSNSPVKGFEIGSDFNLVTGMLAPLFAGGKTRVFLTGCGTESWLPKPGAPMSSGKSAADGRAFIQGISKALGTNQVYGTIGQTSVMGPSMRVEIGGMIAASPRP